jgi:hypothetical protein
LSAINEDGREASLGCRVAGRGGRGARASSRPPRAALPRALVTLAARRGVASARIIREPTFGGMPPISVRTSTPPLWYALSWIALGGVTMFASSRSSRVRSRHDRGRPPR